MQDFHRAAYDAFRTAHAGRRFQSDRLALQRAGLDIDAHLAVLIADVAVDALAFFRRDFELRPAAPEIHPERQRAPHATPDATPDALARKRIKSDRNGSGHRRADIDVVPAKWPVESHQVSNCGDGSQRDEDETHAFPLPRQITFGTSMPVAVANGFGECSTGTNVGTVNFSPLDCEQRDHNKGQENGPHHTDDGHRVPPCRVAAGDDRIQLKRFLAVTEQ